MSSEPRPDVSDATARRAPDRRPRARAVAAPAPLTRGAALVVALLLALAGVLLSAGRADAHNALIGTDPADGSTVATSPAAVTLTFDQPAQALGTEIVVLGPDGATVSTGEAQLVDSTVSTALASDLPAGAYSVEWRVTSADGHPLSGTFAFTATEGAAPAPAADPSEAAEPTEDAAAEPDPEMTTQSDTGETYAELGQADELAEDEDAGVAAGTIAAIVVAVLAAGAVAVFVVRERRRSTRGDGSTPGDDRSED